MDARDLARKLNDFLYFETPREFVRRGKISFKTEEEAKDFLVKFLLVECLAGTGYNNDELMAAHQRIMELIKNEEQIYSEDLPISPRRNHKFKILPNVKYILEGNVCRFEKM